MNTIKNKVSIILVNYNNLKDLDICISSILNQTYDNYEIILVDNNSTDNSLQYVITKWPQIIIVKSKVNLGYAGGINLALNIATGEYVAPLNPDTRVEYDWLFNLITPFLIDKDKRIGVVTPKILIMQNPNYINTMGHNIYINGLSFCRNYNKLNGFNCNKQKIFEKVSGISGCSYIIRKSVLDEIGKVPDVFMSNDDVKLSLLIHLLGLNIYCVTNSTVFHRYQLNPNASKIGRLEKDRLEMMFEIFKLYTLLLLSPILLFTELFTISYCLVKGNKYTKNKLIAYKQIIKDFIKIKAERNKYQQLRKKSDWYILKNLHIIPDLNIVTNLFKKQKENIYELQ